MEVNLTKTEVIELISTIDVLQQEHATYIREAIRHKLEKALQLLLTPLQ